MNGLSYTLCGVSVFPSLPSKLNILESSHKKNKKNKKKNLKAILKTLGIKF